jgi:2-desacetyl-2-hydroxyethyl bacteriochlorophyllide A dehydrogenase
MVVYRGETSPQDRMPATSQGTFPFPVKYGYQVVGRVAAVGADSGFAVGDRVFARHPHQERFTITAQPAFVVPLPDDLDDASATFINLTRVALTGLLDVPVRVGEVAVVFGQGIVGMMCARLARLSASAVVVVDRFAKRRELALKYGADAAVEPADAAAAVAEFSHGRGADVVYEASGAAAALQAALEVVAIEGEIVAVSLYGTTPVPLRLVPEFHYRRPRITSSQAGDQRRWDWVRRTEATVGLLRKLSVTEMIGTRVPFAEASRAYDVIDRNPQDNLGVLLTY